MSRLEFPYQFDAQYRNWYPVIPLRLHGRGGRELEASAYLDSGVGFNILGLAGFFEHLREVAFLQGRRRIVLTP